VITVRCAVYTRKSTEEGLDQEYNSIDAQRDAGHAYIASQRAEGWIPLHDDYDDPAYSGGHMERPALQRLPRLPAAELEAAVLEQLRRVLRAPEMVAGVTEHATRLDPSLDEAQVAVAMTRLDSIWEQLFPAEQQRIVRLLIEKVIVSPSDLEVRFRPNGIEVLALELQPESAAEDVEEAVA
jgi:hypothetical protein